MSCDCDLITNAPVVETLTAVKFTGTQWLRTDYYPNANTEFTMVCKFTSNANTNSSSAVAGGVSPYFFYCAHDGDHRFSFYTGSYDIPYRFQIINDTKANIVDLKGFNTMSDFVVDRTTMEYKKVGSNMTFKFGTHSVTNLPLKTHTMATPMDIGYSAYFSAIFNRWDMTVYSLVIKENGNPVRNYVPVTRNGVPGLRDTVTGTFISSQTASALVAIS